MSVQLYLFSMSSNDLISYFELVSYESQLYQSHNYYSADHIPSLHDETAAAWCRRQEEQRARKPSYESVLNSLRLCVAKLWHFCRVESYGSYCTGLSDSSSDLDLVVCFSDECQTLLGLKG